MELAAKIDVTDQVFADEERGETYPADQQDVIELQRDIAECNRDERRALRVVVNKLKAGRIGKAPLCFATDARDWDAELRDELTDAIWYLAFRVAAKGAP